MARSTDPKRLALWRGRFRRFVGSGLCVARFCVAEDVSVSSFYYWQKKLGPKTRGRPALGGDCHGDRAEGQRVSATGGSIFRPVTVIPATCGVVVRLSSGTRIEVDATQLDAIRAVVAETVRGDHDRAIEQDAPSDSHLIRKRGGAVPC